MPPTRAFLVPFLVAVTACGGGNADDDFPVDALVTDAPSDAQVDAPTDAPIDAPIDAPTEEPQTTITMMPPSLTNLAMTRFEFASSIPGSTFACTIDGGAAISCSSPYARELADGQHEFQVSATSPEGATDLSPAVHSWRIDTAPPVTTILLAPAALDNSVNARFQFISEPEATFQCALDGAPWFACSSPHETAALADGPHAFAIRATDIAGNVEQPNHIAWTLDSGPPDTVIDSGPAAATMASSATFTFSSPDAGAGATFTCQRDSAAAVPCTSPWTVNGLAEGFHTVLVTVRDATGNVDPSPAMRTWRVDTAPPVTAILLAPAALDNSVNARFQFVSEPEATFQCALDGAPWFVCSSPHETAALADGPHTFAIRATDTAGNVAQPNHIAWTLDSGPPDTVIDSGPAAATMASSATFTFSSPDAGAGATFTCQRDSAAAVPCTSPWTVNGLAEGFHTARVTVRDAAGNVDPSPATRTWRVDTAPPVTTILLAPAALDNSVNARFQFVSEPEATFQCALDGAPWFACSSPHETAALADGPHTFAIRATDTAGNVAQPNHIAWTLDSGPPDTVIDSGPAAATMASSATFTFSSPDAGAGATFTCQRDSAAAVPCASPWTVNGLAEGFHTARVTVRDAAGNVDPSPATRTWRVDTTPPTVQITFGPSGTIRDATPTFQFGWSGNVVASECRMIGSVTTAFAPCTSPFTAAALPDGTATFEVRVRDEVGLEGTAERAVTIDTVAPIITITSAPAAVVITPQVTITFTVSETPALLRCRVGPWVMCDGTFTTPVLEDGTHDVGVMARDAAGNVHEVSRTFTVDTEAPTVTITDGPTGTTADTTPTFEFEVPAGATPDTASCQIDQLAPVTPCTSPFTAAALGHGPHVLTVTATDQAAHSGSATRAFSVDTTPLTVTITNGPSGVYTSRPSVSYAYTGPVVDTSCRVDNGFWVACGGGQNTWWPTFSIPDGVHTYSIQVYDDTGATAIATTSTFTLDSTAPVVTFLSGPTGGQEVRTSPVTYEFTVTGDPVATECSFHIAGPAGTFQPCTSPQVVTPTTPWRQYRFEVRVRDVHGNQRTYDRWFNYVP